MSLKRKIIDHSAVIFAGFLYAVALKYFVLPSKIILTGTEGIASSLSYYFDSYRMFIVLYLAFQGVLLLFAYFKVSKSFAYYSFLVVLCVAFALHVLPELSFAQPEPQNERIILVLFGGLLAGVAKAISFKHRGSTGDEDIIGAFFAMKLLKPVGAISIIAAIVSTSFGLSLDFLKNREIESTINTLMYSSIYIFVSSEILNNLYKKFQTTLLTIFTSDHERVGKGIKEVFDHRTFTVQTGKGGYRGGTISIINTIITREELPFSSARYKPLIRNAFIIIRTLMGLRKSIISPRLEDDEIIHA